MTIEKLTAGDPDIQSADITAGNVERLRELFPDAFTEGRIDFDVLRQLLGDAVEDGDERYGLNWRGKRAARRLALTPSTGTLRPAPEDSVDWDTTQNLMIEGDNLEVLKLLRKSYAGKVKLAYIDPPYNTGRDFVYRDDFHDSIQNYLEITGQLGEAGRLTSNTESSGRFHTSWLSMMYPRLLVARDLLTTDGVMFVSIDDSEVANLRLLCDDIFGGDNFVATFVWQKRVSPDNDERHVTATHDYVVCYMRDKEGYSLKGYSRTEEQDARYLNPDNDPRGPWTSSDLTRREYREHDFYEITLPSGRKVTPAAGRSWSVPPAKYQELVADNRIWFGPTGDSMPRTKRFLTDVSSRLVPVTWLPSELSADNQTGKRELISLFPELNDVFETPKPVDLISNLIRMTCGDDDIILDFFAGTGTTGEAVFRRNATDGANRRFILVQLPEPGARTGFESLADLTEERLRRAGAKIRKEAPMFVGDLGFRVFKLDSSNIREWDPQPEKLDAALELSVENLKVDRTEHDILYELLLKRGIELTVPIEEREITGKAVQNIGAGTLFTCLAERIARKDAEALALGIVAWRDELAPAGDIRVVFRDSAFVDDVAKTNLAEILRQHGLADVKSI